MRKKLGKLEDDDLYLAWRSWKVLVMVMANNENL